MASEPKPDVFDLVHEAFDRGEVATRDPVGESPSLSRQAVDAVLDLHHEYKGHCYECSQRIALPNWPRGAVKFPCSTVQAILKAAKVMPK